MRKVTAELLRSLSPRLSPSSAASNGRRNCAPPLHSLNQLIQLCLFLLPVNLYALSAVLLHPLPVRGESGEYSHLSHLADGAYRSGSWGVSYKLYRQLAPLAPSREDANRIRFRASDSLWRIRGSDDPTSLMRSRDELRALISELGPQEQTKADALESLGDLYWTVKRVSNWKAARPHYEAAINFWLSVSETAEREDRIFAIIAKIARPPWKEPTSVYGEGQNFLSPALLLRVVPFASTPEHSSLIHYMLAQTLHSQGVKPENVRGEFEQARRSGKGSRWHDEMLFAYAQWEERQEVGLSISASESRALPLYREIVASFDEKSSPFYERAEQLSRIMATPDLRVFVPSVQPGRPWTYALQVRNVRSVLLSLYRFEPDELIDPSSPVVGRAHWGVGNERWFDLASRRKQVAIKQWTVAGADLFSEKPRSDGAVLPRGGYILQASGGGVTVREQFFVTDLYLGYSRLTDRVRLYAASLSSGAPLEGVKFRVWEKRSTAIDTPVIRYLGESGPDGIAEIALNSKAPDTQFLDPSTVSPELFELLAVAKSPSGDSSAILDPEVFARRESDAPWEVHFRTNSPLYCPGEALRFSLFAKKRDWFRRSHDVVIAELVHPFDKVVSRASSPISEFGEASGSLSISPKWRPGDYRIDLFHTTTLGGLRKQMGEHLFRVEERCPPR